MTRKTTGRRTESTTGALTGATIVGLKAARQGVDRGEYLILIVGDNVEKVIKVPKEIYGKG